MQKGLSYYDFTLMALIYQNSTDDMSEEILLHVTDESLKRLHALDMVSLIKAKKKSDNDFMRIRLSKKGKEVFKNAQIVDYTEQDEALLDKLKEAFTAVDKQIGNDVKVKKMLAWFRTETQLPRKYIYIAIRKYILGLQEENKLKYMPTLENLLWKGQNVFATKWDLADSKLYQFIQEHKEHLDGYTASKN